MKWEQGESGMRFELRIEKFDKNIEIFIYHLSEPTHAAMEERIFSIQKKEWPWINSSYQIKED